MRVSREEKRRGKETESKGYWGGEGKGGGGRGELEVESGPSFSWWFKQRLAQFTQRFQVVIFAIHLLLCQHVEATAFFFLACGRMALSPHLAVGVDKSAWSNLGTRVLGYVITLGLCLSSLLCIHIYISALARSSAASLNFLSATLGLVPLPQPTLPRRCVGPIFSPPTPETNAQPIHQ